MQRIREAGFFRKRRSIGANGIHTYAIYLIWIRHCGRKKDLSICPPLISVIHISRTLPPPTCPNSNGWWQRLIMCHWRGHGVPKRLICVVSQCSIKIQFTTCHRAAAGWYYFILYMRPYGGTSYSNSCVSRLLVIPFPSNLVSHGTDQG